MADFSEVCPLFDTGVYREITLPEYLISDAISASTNMQHGFKFGKTVVVTNAWVVKTGTSGYATSTIFNIMHITTISITVASQTLVASWCFQTSAASQTIGHALTMNMAQSTTFTSTDLLSTHIETAIDDGGEIGVIIRYRDA